MKDILSILGVAFVFAIAVLFGSFLMINSYEDAIVNSKPFVIKGSVYTCGREED